MTYGSALTVDERLNYDEGHLTFPAEHWAFVRRFVIHAASGMFFWREIGFGPVEAAIDNLLRVYIADAGQGLLRAMAESQSQTGAEEHVITLDARRRIADVAVVERYLPAQPGIEGGDRANVEQIAVLAGFGNVRIKIESLAETRAWRDLV